MTTDKGQTRPDGIDPDAPRSAPTIRDQADKVLSGEATHVDTGRTANEEPAADSKPNKAAKKASGSK
jgi:hypothetical protein